MEPYKIQYIFYDKVRNQTFKSPNLLIILKKFKNQLELSELGISFLLQNGVIPYPFTVFKHLYIEGFGIKINHLEEDFKKIRIYNNFPFNIGGFNKPDEKTILNLIKKSTENQLLQKESFLFHSAGKDSNMIALALSDSDYKNNITFITQAYSGSCQEDESLISKKISDKLGFKHITVKDNVLFDERDLDMFFYEQPFPCLDNMSLIYTKYSNIIGNNKNVIDGMGNDIYMGHISPIKEKINQFFYSKLNFLRKYLDFSSINLKNFKLKTRAEFTGFYGFSEYDIKRIYKNYSDINFFWINFNKINKNEAFENLRSRSRGVFLDNEMFIRKIRNFCDINHHNLVLPFYSRELIDYITSLDKKYLYNLYTRENKLIFREILKKRLNLDYKIIKKRSLEYNFDSFIYNQRELIENTIYQCSFLDAKSILSELYKNLNHKKYNNLTKFLIIRLFLLAGWLSKSKYINRN